jgi:CDP-diacylglycerol--glycerol-3-phosphate 3-phosphatidyltransferase
MTRSDKLRIVNTITLARLPLVFLFLAGAVLNAFLPSVALFSATFLALILASFTDLFDGYYARRWDVVTAFGAHIDPLMDKVFYLVALPVLVLLAGHNGNWPHAVVLLVLTVVFLARDQWVSFLRAIGAMYNVSGKAHWSGKLRTATNFPIVCLIYYYQAAPGAAQIIPLPLTYVLEAVALILTIVSLVIYTGNYMPYIKRSLGVSD